MIGTCVLLRFLMAPFHTLYYFIYPPSRVATVVAGLWHDSPLRQLARSKPMPAERLHMTLQQLGSFSGPIPPEVLDLALTVGRRMMEEPFDLSLDLLRSRSAKDVRGTVELTGQGPAVAKLRRFHRRLAIELEDAGFPVARIRKSLVPHVTLDYEHTPVPLQAIAPIAWRVSEFFLVDSLRGQGRHEVLASWPLIERQATFGW